MRRLKSFGERIASQDPDRQAAEIHTHIALMNRFSALGQAKITRVAPPREEKGKLDLKPSCATTPLAARAVGRLHPQG